MEIFAQELSEKTVVDSTGAVVGTLHNVTMNYNTGELNNLLVNPEGSPSQRQMHRSKYTVDDQGRYLVSASSVKAVKDQVVIN